MCSSDLTRYIRQALNLGVGFTGYSRYTRQALILGVGFTGYTRYIRQALNLGVGFTGYTRYIRQALNLGVGFTGYSRYTRQAFNLGVGFTRYTRYIRQALNLGVGFTAHPRFDARRNHAVGWSWAAPLVGDSLTVDIFEWDASSGEQVHKTSVKLPSPIAPHDFAITDNWCGLSPPTRRLRLRGAYAYVALTRPTRYC